MTKMQGKGKRGEQIEPSLFALRRLLFCVKVSGRKRSHVAE
jgi:hypothetical protein